ncbi:flagellar hook-length control protein FliK [Novosphingobium sp.]|uniref:flagellar hook-length control protein FliK n=1 Tax=Novosphingobium sp. TaxID=1874826 RepID=UPI003D6D1594
MNSLFPMAAATGGSTSAAAVSGVAAADSLAGALAGGGAFKSAEQATGSFQSLLGAAQAAPAGAASGTVQAGAPATAATVEAPAAAELIPAPVISADTLAQDAAAAAGALPAENLLAKPATSTPGAKPADVSHAAKADHIKPPVAKAEALLPQLVAEAAASADAAPTGETGEAAGDAAPAADADADAPEAKHLDADASALIPAGQAQVPQTPTTAVQPQLAVAPQAVPAPSEDVPGETAKTATDGEGKASVKLAKTGNAGTFAGAERAAAEPAGARGQGAAANAASPVDTAQAPDQAAATPDGNLSAPLFSQTLNAATSRPAALPYAPTAQSAPQSATVAVQQGQFGNDIGVEIARALDKGSDDLLIRLDPRHLGRIDVRLSFDHDGVLRAVVSADSASSLDMLRRESTDLNRALADAGVRSDGQSLRFDSRSGGQGGGQRWQGEQNQRQAQSGLSDGFGGSDDPIYRPLRSSGHVDLMA